MALDHMPARRWRPVLQIVAPREARRAEVFHTATRLPRQEPRIPLPAREQQTNADAVPPESQWRGYRPPPEPPAPAPGTWGDPSPMPCVLAGGSGGPGER